MYFISSKEIASNTISCLEETGLGGPGIVSVERSGIFKRVSIKYNIEEEQQDDVFACLTLSFKPSFFWSPHLTPKDGYIAQQHIFRTPALIARGEGRTLIVIPDVKIADQSENPWYLDMDAVENKFYIGMSLSAVAEHVLYVKKPGAVWHKKAELAFYVYETDEELENPFRVVLNFFWNSMGSKDSTEYLGFMSDLTPYVEHTYRWAFEHWEKAVWQEFDLNGKRVGAPCFIVNVTQSPNYPGEISEREMRSVWNQAWFNSLRSASGLYRYAKRTGNGELLERALMTKELALAFPQKEGLFDGVIATEMTTVEKNGEKFNRSCGWNTLYLGNSNRNPYTRSVKNSPKHILDMAFTCYYMLVWYSELEQDERLLRYAENFADRLIKLQTDDGFYPAWVHDDGEPYEHLNKSPESSMSAAFLLKLYSLTGVKKYFDSAEKALNAVNSEIVPTGKWEDFETYWSCCRYHNDNVGNPIKRNAMFKQCSFSMYFTALAFLEAYKARHDMNYLQKGVRVLDEMLMLQSSYQPKNMPIPVVGGFGVMNSDAELNDSRQSLFAPLIMEYGELLANDEYRERGIAALKAGFSMMYCPENQHTKIQWEQKWNFFNEKDYGFMMENYGHNGFVANGGIGIGVFTIYDWGNGAASEAWETSLARGLLNNI